MPGFLPPFRRLLAMALRLGLGGFFLAAGLFKLSHPTGVTGFARIIGDYGLIPSALLLPAAWALIASEIIGGLLTLLRLRGGLALTSGMLLMFVGVLAYGLHLGLDVDCGCFGPGDPESVYHAGMWFALWRDVFMLAATGLVLWLERRPRLIKLPAPLLASL